MSPRTGRPPSDNPKINQYRIRMSDDEERMLNACCEATKLSKAEVIRLGITKVYEEVKK